MSLQSELVSIEKNFWSGDADFYRKHLDVECLTAFPDMAGIASREEVAQMVRKDEPRWRNVLIDVKGLIQPAPGVAILTYEATADRDEDEHYEALVSSAYVKRGSEWKLAFHQQTPLGDLP